MKPSEVEGISRSWVAALGTCWRVGILIQKTESRDGKGAVVGSGQTTDRGGDGDRGGVCGGITSLSLGGWEHLIPMFVCLFVYVCISCALWFFLFCLCFVFFCLFFCFVFLLCHVPNRM